MADSRLRFFVDENLVALGKALTAVRDDVAFPGCRHLPEVPRETLDPDWIPVVGRLGLIVLTRDKRIRSNPGNRQALLAAGLRVVVLGPKRDLGRWDQLDLVVRAWSKLEALIATPGPWVAQVTTGSVKMLPTSSDGSPQIGR